MGETFGQALRRLRIDADLSQPQLARQIPVSQASLSRYESGKQAPDLRTVHRLDDVLAASGTLIALATGTGRFSLVAKFPIMDAGQLEDEDVQRRALLKTAGLGASFLAISADQDNPRATSTLPQRAVDRQDIAVMREMTANFRRLDNRFGGGHAYSVVDNFISTHVESTIRFRRCSETLRADLFPAAVELYQLAGWMAYDIGDQANGGRHLHTALSLCKEVRDEALAAEMLAGMSHQASFNRQADSAVQLASAAGYAARRAGVPKLQAEAAVMEAHGLGLRGDQRGCIASLQRAERYFVAGSGSAPEWLGYFDEAYLSAKFGHALRDLKRPADAERFARGSLQMTEGYERGRLFNTALLAGVLADQGKVEESIQHASLAVQMSGSMRSVRATTYLTDVYNRLLPYKGKESVRSLCDAMKDAGVRTRFV